VDRLKLKDFSLGCWNRTSPQLVFAGTRLLPVTTCTVPIRHNSVTNTAPVHAPHPKFDPHKNTCSRRRKMADKYLPPCGGSYVDKRIEHRSKNNVAVGVSRRTIIVCHIRTTKFEMGNGFFMPPLPRFAWFQISDLRFQISEEFFISVPPPFAGFQIEE